MRAIEFDFDTHLLDLCQMVLHNVDTEDDPGMVAACVIDPNGTIESETSSKRDNKWVHAERNAIDSYEKKYGTVPEDSIVVVTLSPCNERRDDTAEERHGESCTDYLNSKGIRTVYCGYIDPTQDDKQAEFKQILTRDKKIRKMCKSFAETFLPIKD